MEKKPADDHDTAWKEIAREYFPLLLEYFFPLVARRIDWERDVEFLDKEIKHAVRLAGKGARAVDMLAKVWRENGEQASVLVHLEFQSQVDRKLPKRMLEYRVLLGMREQLSVESLCILADPDPAWRPEGYEEKAIESALILKYPTVKLLDYRARWEELERDPNPFAMVVMAHLRSLESKRSPRRRLRMKTELMVLMHERGYSEKVFLDLWRFVELVMPLGEELQLIFEDEVKSSEKGDPMAKMTQWERHATEKGIRLGIEQGALQNAREMVLDALQERYPDAPTTLRARVSELADVGALRGLHHAILRANSVQDIEQRLPSPN